ncbi:MAG: ammonium transporter [Cocleimonas sp.]|nr:ammonium transporter [Cocleimonas sp.]
MKYIFTLTSLLLLPLAAVVLLRVSLPIRQPFQVQLIGVTALVSYRLFKLIGLVLGGLRVSANEEAQGIDIIDHEKRGYVLSLI